MKTFKTKLSLIELKDGNARQLELLQKAKKENNLAYSIDPSTHFQQIPVLSTLCAGKRK